MQQIVRQYRVFPELGFVERVETHPVARVERVGPQGLAKRHVDVVVCQKRLEGAAAEAEERVELKTAAPQECVHVREHRLVTVELDEFDFGLNQECPGKRSRCVTENREFAPLHVNLDEIRVVYFRDIVELRGAYRMLCNRPHELREILELLEQRRVGS